MRRRTLLSCVVALGLALAPAAAADRETGFTDIPSSSVQDELTAGMALAPDGRTMGVWSTVTKPGALEGAELSRGSWHRFRRAAQGQVHGVAVVYDAKGVATLAWADDGGLAVAPARATGAAATRLVPGPADAVALARLRGSGLVAAALVRASDGEHLWVAFRDGGVWEPRDLGLASAPAYPGAPALQVAAYGTGFALAYLSAGGRLVIDAYDAPDAPVQRRLLPVGRHGEARLATGPDGSLWVLYGGLPPGKHRGEYGFARLVDGSLRVHVLQRDLECDSSGYLVGVGWLGTVPRLLYGYGCDIAWQLHTLSGHVTTDPSTGSETIYAVAAASLRGRIAALVVTQRGGGAHLATARFGP